MKYAKKMPQSLLGAFFAAWLLTGCTEAPPAAPAAQVQIELHGRDLPYPEWRTLRLVWNPLLGIEFQDRPTVFLHLLDKEGLVVRTFDHPLPNRWRLDEALEYEVQLYQSALGPPLPSGDYDLTLGLYLMKNGQRFPLEGAGEEVARQEYKIATISVPPIDPKAPSFSLPSPWQAPLEGNDTQILSRRHLASEGQLIIENLEVPGSLWLRLVLPPVVEDHQRLLLSDARDTPVLDVTSNCSGTVRSLPMPGEHEIVLPVFPVGEVTECVLTLSSNYSLIDRLSPVDRIASLEVLAWAGAEL